MEWSQFVARSSVRLQWDPDHNPSGGAIERRAIQLGLRGKALEAFGQRELLEVIDISDVVANQRTRLQFGGVASLVTPRERVFVPANETLFARLRLEIASRETQPISPNRFRDYHGRVRCR